MRRRDYSIEGDTVVFFRVREYHAKSKLHVIMEPVWFLKSDDAARLKRLGRRWRDTGKLGKPVLH